MTSFVKPFKDQQPNSECPALMCYGIQYIFVTILPYFVVICIINLFTQLNFVFFTFAPHSIYFHLIKQYLAQIPLVDLNEGEKFLIQIRPMTTILIMLLLSILIILAFFKW